MSAAQMTPDQEQIVRRAYTEAALAAKEKGLSGAKAVAAVLAAAAKVATRMTGISLTPAQVEAIVHRR